MTAVANMTTDVYDAEFEAGERGKARTRGFFRAFVADYSADLSAIASDGTAWEPILNAAYMSAPDFLIERFDVRAKFNAFATAAITQELGLKADQRAMRFSGLMGHEFLVVIDTNDGRSVCAELNTVDQARSMCNERSTKNPAAYQRTGKGWARIAI